VIDGEQLFSLRELVRWCLPAHVEDSFDRPQKVLRLSMTIDAPLHFEGRGSPRQGHLIDSAVASGATDAFCNMNAVVEVDKIGQGVDANPTQRPVFRETCEHRCENFLVAKNLRVAGHASRGRRNASKGRRFHGDVAEAAIQPHVAHVMLVAKRRRLGNGCVDRRRLGNAVAPDDDESGSNYYDQTSAQFEQEHEPWTE